MRGKRAMGQPRKGQPTKGRRGRTRRLHGVECLETRALLTALPYGAAVEDTGEFMLGSVLVTPVFMESVGTHSTSTEDPSVENWTPALVAEAMQKIEDGLQWWVDLLATQNSVHSLRFEIDDTFVNDPVETLYEPIARTSNAYADWTDDFLDTAGFNNTGDVLQDIWDFNHAQRLKFDTNWAFTIFVVNSTLDSNDSFASGGDFQRAFAFSGGRFLVFPSGRPASTVAHEIGHMFWALDEYRFSASWHDTRGYYETQNLNAYDNNPQNPFVQADSIMANETSLDSAYLNHVSPPSTLAMIGWRDSDGDGIFDVLDVPHSLSGGGYFDSTTRRYHFQGQSEVGTRPNLNSSGNGNDITINKISRAEYRIDGTGPWQTAASFDAYSVNLNLTIDDARLASGTHTIQIRTVDAATGITSPVFEGSTEQPASTVLPGINGGVWNDTDGDGQWDSGETGVSGALVRLVDASQQPLVLITAVEPDSYTSNFQLLNDVVPGITLSAIGSGVADNSVLSRVGGTSSTGSRVFAHYRSGNFVGTEWTPVSRRLKIEMDNPVAVLSIDAVGVNSDNFGRLDVFDASGNLLQRYTTDALNSGQVETMHIRRDMPDIAYAIAYAHGISAIRLDNLRVGPETTTTTDARGAYSLPGLPAGTYNVRVTPSANWVATSPNPSQSIVTLQTHETLVGVDFGGRASASPWQNPSNRYDVSGDGIVAPNDALRIINDLNAQGARTLPVPGPGMQPPPYLDVSGDGIVAPNDVLAVANRLNSPPGQSEGGQSEGGQSEGGQSDGKSPSGGLPEGWGTPAGRWPAFAAGASEPQAEGEARRVWFVDGRWGAETDVQPLSAGQIARTLALDEVASRKQSRREPAGIQATPTFAESYRRALRSLPSADWDSLLDEIDEDIGSGRMESGPASR